MKNKITKKEKKQLIAILLGISAYSFLSRPLQSAINSFNLSNGWMFVIGILFLLGIYKLFDIA